MGERRRDLVKENWATKSLLRAIIYFSILFFFYPFCYPFDQLLNMHGIALNFYPLVNSIGSYRISHWLDIIEFDLHGRNYNYILSKSTYSVRHIVYFYFWYHVNSTCPKLYNSLITKLIWYSYIHIIISYMIAYMQLYRVRVVKYFEILYTIMYRI